MTHTTVLPKESIDGLNIQTGDTFVDCTLGDGGHSVEVLKRFGNEVTIVGIDRDENSLAVAKANIENLKTDSQKIFLKLGNFRNVDQILHSCGFGEAERFLFDIGLSSRQLEESGRGFSFQKSEPLLMTFEKSKETGITAKEIVNEWDEENIATIIRGYGEEKFAHKIAKGIVETRKVKAIETTGDLVEVILKSTPFFYHHGRIHPATRTFQALRIAVNDELGAIKAGLAEAWKMLAPKGRIAVISFHSLEDRIVKHYFNELKETGAATVITKKPITASEEENSQNPRARSAKLRIIEKN